VCCLEDRAGECLLALNVDEVMMEIIEVENYIDEKWTRRLHLMSNDEIKVDELEPPYIFPDDDAQVELTREAGVYHLRAVWQARDAFAGTLRGDDRQERALVLWALKDGDRISTSVQAATVEFRRAFARNPHYAAVRRMPRGVDDLCEIAIDDGRRTLVLVECADVLDRFVVVY
jgi:hypothetical protein